MEDASVTVAQPIALARKNAMAAAAPSSAALTVSKTRPPRGSQIGLPPILRQVGRRQLATASKLMVGLSFSRDGSLARGVK